MATYKTYEVHINGNEITARLKDNPFATGLDDNEKKTKWCEIEAKSPFSAVQQALMYYTKNPAASVPAGAKYEDRGEFVTYLGRTDAAVRLESYQKNARRPRSIKTPSNEPK